MTLPSDDFHGLLADKVSGGGGGSAHGGGTTGGWGSTPHSLSPMAAMNSPRYNLHPHGAGPAGGMATGTGTGMRSSGAAASGAGIGGMSRYGAHRVR